jgi:hypothetical protein
MSNTYVDICIRDGEVEFERDEEGTLKLKMDENTIYFMDDESEKEFIKEVGLL